jgi:hypothetical protein
MSALLNPLKPSGNYVQRALLVMSMPLFELQLTPLLFYVNKVSCFDGRLQRIT